MAPDDLTTRAARQRALAAALAATILLLAGIENGATAQEPRDAPLAQVDAKDADSARFREEHGLRNDAAHRQTARLTGRSDEYGVPLFDDELTELHARREVERALPKVDLRAREEPGFGGIWFDQKAGGEVVVQLTTSEDRSRLRDELTAFLPSHRRVRIETVAWELADLERLHQRIARDLDTLRSEGFDVAGIGTDVRENHVAVHVLDLNDERRAELDARYGNDPRIAWLNTRASGLDDGPRTNSPGQLKAGLKITSATGSYCTAGFAVDRGTWPGTRYLLTAGHCGAVGSTWDHNWDANYQMSANFTQTGSTADAAAIGVPFEDASNLLYLEADDIAAVFGTASIDFPGVTRCKSGMGSGTTCGTVTNSSYIHVAGGATIFDTTVATYTRAGGDSGGPVYEPNAVDSDGVRRINAAGLHRGAVCDIFDSCNAIYSKIGNVLTQLNASLVIGIPEIRIQARHSARCIDVVGGGTANGTGVQQWDCNGNFQQRFDIRPVGGNYQIRPLHSLTLCLDVPGSSVTTVNLIMYQCNLPPTANQLWQFQQVDRFHFDMRPSHNSGSCIDVTSASTFDGASLLQYSCHGGENQQWHFISP
jgi:hypothetical protein